VLKFEGYRPLDGETAFDAHRAIMYRDDRLGEIEFKYAINGCSDSRCPEDQLLPGGAFVMMSAGNLPDIDQIPNSIKSVITVAHGNKYDSGCGACQLAGDITKDMEIPEELRYIGLCCKDRPDANAMNITTGLSSKFEVGTMFYNQATGIVNRIGSSSTDEDVLRLMRDIERSFKDAKYNPTSSRGDMREGQNPRLVVINLGVQYTFAELARNGGFDGPNMVYEVKPGGTDFTTIAIGSTQYPLLHALSKDPEAKNFKDTDSALFLVRDRSQLAGIEEIVSKDPAFAHFMTENDQSRKGRVFAMSITTDNHIVDEMFELHEAA